MDELSKRPDRIETGVPLVVTCHPLFHNFSSIIRKYFSLLCAKEKVKRVFTPALFASFCSGYSLRNHLFRSKVDPLIREHFVLERPDVKLIPT